MALRVYGYSSVPVMPARRVMPVRPAPVRSVDNAKIARLARLEVRVGVYSRRGLFSPSDRGYRLRSRAIDTYV